MFALIVKNDEETWDIYLTVVFPNHFSDRIKRIENAIASGLPIVGMDLTAYRERATSGAVFDGVDFSGGAVHPMTRNGNNNWDTLTQYGYICNNTLLLILFSQPGTERDNEYQAIFDSETTIVEVPEGQIAQVGDIWDGEKVINRV
jgi:hypothetical protein